MEHTFAVAVDSYTLNVAILYLNAYSNKIIPEIVENTLTAKTPNRNSLVLFGLANGHTRRL